MSSKKAQTAVTYFYLLEPGDGTRYQFNITRCESLAGVLPGVTPKHILVGFKDYSSFVIEEHEALDPKRYMTAYAMRQSNAPAYTIAAVLLAASVLLKNPEDLTEACKRMLHAQKLLS
jgi:hypothetical protein